MQPRYLVSLILIIFGLIALTLGVSSAAPNNTVNVTMNDSFNITLASNPSTGHHWTASYDGNYLNLVNETYVASAPAVGPGGFPVIGAGGNQIFTFLAIQPGDTLINFTYARGSNIANSTVYEVLIAGVTPANNSTNTTNVTPNNNTNTIPMQDTGLPVAALAVGVLSVTAGLIASKKK